MLKYKTVTSCIFFAPSIFVYAIIFWKLKTAITIKEFELKGEVAACKQALNPVTYLNRIITKLYTMENMIKYFVKGYEFVKGIFNNKTEEDNINNPTNN